MNFFPLKSKLLSSTLQIRPTNLSPSRNRQNLFPVQFLIMGEYNDVRFPVLFEYESGKNICDILDTGWPGLYLYVNIDTCDWSDFFVPESNLGIKVTERVAALLAKEKISNLELTNLKDREIMT